MYHVLSSKLSISKTFGTQKSGSGAKVDRTMATASVRRHAKNRPGFRLLWPRKRLEPVGKEQNSLAVDVASLKHRTSRRLSARAVHL
ncbi:MAG TPA: hypothetical protein DHU16_07580 [Gammaproteobacteria bacterium]|nr:hypothetical protein [Gammaproteobacteria bacterium]